MNRDETMTHEEVRELLPWFVNDSLDDVEHERVDAHARSCVICRRELQELRQMRTSIRQQSEDAPIPEPDMRRINARIDALIDRQERGGRWLLALKDFFASPQRLAIAAQAAAIAVLLGVLLWPEPQTPRYTTLTASDALPEGTYIRVVFDPALAATDVAAIVEANGLEVVNGPSPRGVAVLRVQPTATEVDSESVVNALLAGQGVLFAQPIERRE